MNIKRSFAEGEKLNVSLTATTYERVKETRRKRTPGHRHPGAHMTPDRFRAIRAGGGPRAPSGWWCS